MIVLLADVCNCFQYHKANNILQGIYVLETHKKVFNRNFFTIKRKRILESVCFK